MADTPTQQADSSEVVYSVDDKSLLLPVLKRYVYRPLAAKIPARVSPNTLTLAGAGCSTLALVSVTMADGDARSFYFVAALLVLAYMTLDNLDGAHARRTGQSSILGEFLDHWLDTLASGLVVATVAWALELPPLLFMVVLACNALAFFATFYEQHKTGHLQMDAMGNIEGLLLSFSLLTTMAIFGPDAVIAAPLLGNASIQQLLPLAQLMSTLFTVGGVLWRTGSLPSAWLQLPLMCGAVMVWVALGRISLAASAAILVLCNPLFAGRHISARILGQRAPQASWSLALPLIGAAAASVTLNLAAAPQTTLVWSSFAWLAVHVCRDFLAVTRHRAADLRAEEFLGRFLLR